MNIFRTTLLLLAFGLAWTYGHTTTYTTLANGSWDNTTNVWSTDGVTPCGCFPGWTTSGTGDVIIVNHQVELVSFNLVISANDQMQINGWGNVWTSGASNVTVSGDLTIWGSMIVSRLRVNVGGTVNSHSYIQITNGASDIFGTLNILAGTYRVESGNIRVYAGAFLNMGPLSLIEFQAGNLEVTGTTTMDGACVYFYGGNARVNAGGSMSGNGAVETAGNINNQGTWEASITWCAGGSSSGMPTPPDCSGATACSGAVGSLGVELAEFSPRLIENGDVLVTWKTISESNSAAFEIEHSRSGNEFSFVQSIEAAGNSTSLTTYSHTFESLEPGVHYFRLIIEDLDGSRQVLRTASMFLSEASLSDYAFVHRAEYDQIELIPTASKTGTFTFQLIDLNGRVHNTETVSANGTSGNSVTMSLQNLSKGVYIINGSFDGQPLKRIKFVK